MPAPTPETAEGEANTGGFERRPLTVICAENCAMRGWKATPGTLANWVPAIGCGGPAGPGRQPSPSKLVSTLVRR